VPQLKLQTACRFEKSGTDRFPTTKRRLVRSSRAAYHPIVDILKGNLGVRDGDGDKDTRDKVERGLTVLQADDAATKPYLLELLSAKDSGFGQIALSPEGKKDRTLQALNRIVLKGAEIRPVVMVVEDLHWMDPSSENVFQDLLEHIAGARVLLLFTYRTEYVHTWGGRSYHSQVNLNRLSNRETLALVTQLLGTEEVEDNLRELILERTEGVPFFVEELVKSLKDLRVIERKNRRWRLTKNAVAVAIPNTIQDVILARVDSLPDAAKALLQTGSVAGREFPHELLKEVTGLPEPELLANLSALEDSELVYERGIFPDSVYVFKHALTQTVVYDSILSQKQKELHNAVGVALEQMRQGSANASLAVLAEHCERGGEARKAADYFKSSMRLALDKVAIPEAIDYARHKIACLERLPRSEETQKEIIDARATLGHLYLNVNQCVALKEAVDPVMGLAEELSYTRGLAGVASLLGAYYYSAEEYSKAIEYLQKGIAFSEESNNTVAYLHAHNYMGWTLADICQFEKAHLHFDKALAVSTKSEALWGIAAIRTNIAWGIYGLQGKLIECDQMFTEILDLAEQSGDIWSRGYVYGFYGMTCYCRGLFDQAKTYILKGAELNQKLRHDMPLVISETFLGATYLVMEDYEKASYTFDHAAEVAHGKFFPSWIALCRVASSLARAMMHEKDVDVAALRRWANGNKVKVFEGLMQRYFGELLLNLDDSHLDEAEERMKRAIQADEANGLRFHLGQDHLAYAELLRRKGDLPRTHETLQTAAAIFTECGSDGWVKRTEERLAQL
jgi:tetratricopeptide (TPR) repeat protein